MKLDQVTSGRIYVDVNVFYMYLRSDPEHVGSTRSLLQRMVRGELAVYTAVLTMDELFYRLLLASVKDAYERSPLDVVRENPQEAIKACSPRIDTALRKLVRLPHLTLASVLEADFPRMLENITAYGLLPRDAFHLTVMQRLEVNEIATDDPDFDRVPGLERHWVFNAPASLSDPREA